MYRSPREIIADQPQIIAFDRDSYSLKLEDLLMGKSVMYLHYTISEYTVDGDTTFLESEDDLNASDSDEDNVATEQELEEIFTDLIGILMLRKNPIIGNVKENEEECDNDDSQDLAEEEDFALP